jgi:outer membrane protein assembly factor BamA
MISINRTINYSIAASMMCLALTADVECRSAGQAETPVGIAEDQQIEHTVTKVSIIGGHGVKRSLVLSRFAIHPGDTFSADLSERGIERVQRLSGVESAFLRIMPDRDTGGVQLIIVISDADTRLMRPALSRGLTNDWSYGLRFEETNLRGADERLDALLLLGGAAIAKASWLKPFFVENPSFGVGFRVGYEDYDYPYPDYGRLLTDNRIKRFEATGLIRYNITDYFHLSIIAGVDVIEIADTISTDPLVPASPSGTFTTLEFVLSADLRNRSFYPSGGFRLHGGRKDWAVLQSDAEMRNFFYWAEGSGYRSIGRFIGVLRAKAAFAGGEVPLLLQNHLGGEGSIRGYDFGVFSGENSLLTTAEVRLPLNFRDPEDPGNPLILCDFHIFTDSGSCWSDPLELSDAAFNTGFGCGINIIPAKRGLLSLDYAWRMETSGIWQLNAGFYF